MVAKIPYPDLKDESSYPNTRHPETYGDAWYEAETARTWLQMMVISIIRWRYRSVHSRPTT